MVLTRSESLSTQHPSKDASLTPTSHADEAAATGGALQSPTSERTIGTRKLYTIIHNLLNLKPVLPGSGGRVSNELSMQCTTSVNEFNEGQHAQEVAARRAQTPEVPFTFTAFTEPLPWDVMCIIAALLCEHVYRDTRRAEEQLLRKAMISPRLHAMRSGDAAPHPQTAAIASAAPTFLVSVGTRGCGSLAQAMAFQLQIPYSLSNWYPDGSVGDLRVDRCEGVGGHGWIYLNGLPPRSRVAVVIDTIHSGVTAARLARGVREVADNGSEVVGIYAVAEYETGSRAYLAESLPLGTPIHSLFSICVDHERTIASTRVVSSLKQDAVSCAAIPATCRVPRSLPESTMRQLKRLPAAEVEAKLRRVSASFINVPIVVNDKVSYPYCFFSLTDCKPALDPMLVEDMADLAVHFGDFHRCDVLVSEADRGGGPLLQAISVRTRLPYVSASWVRILPNEREHAAQQNSDMVQSQVTHVGFSGQHSQLSLRGLRPGMRCIFIDDMLSSGGTAEAVLDCVNQLGATTVESVFVSEKLYPYDDRTRLPERRGKSRLQSVYPDMVVTCLVQFVVDGKTTTEPPCRVGE